MKKIKTFISAAASLSLLSSALVAMPAEAATQLTASMLFTPTANVATCTVLTSDLTIGSKDVSPKNQVTALQQFLLVKGYFHATPTGYFGSVSAASVKAYQSANKISSTGYVGPLTRASIQATSCVGGTTGGSTANPQIPVSLNGTACPAGYTCTPPKTQ